MPDEQIEFGDDRPDLDTVKEMRREHPSGWLELAKDPALALLIDAILDSPDGYEFSPPEIAPRAGITAQSVRNHISILVERGVLEQVSESRYKIREDGRVTTQLNELNSAVTAVRSGGSEGLDHAVDPDDVLDNSQTSPSARMPLSPTHPGPVNAD